MYGKKSSKLILSADALVFQPNRSFNKGIIRIPKEDIQDFRYGVRWLKGLEFTIGREYQLFIRTKDNQEFSIRSKTYYGYKRNHLHRQFYDMVNHIWSNYFWKITENYLNMYSQGKDFRVCDVLISSDGINIESGGSFKRNRTFIKWENVGFRAYHSSYSLFSKENPADINRGYYHLKDWNVAILSCIVENILKARNLN